MTNLGHVVETIANKFSTCHILVVGDLMLDLYEWGVVERISPEAPVPVVRIHRQTATGGGAANVALNLAALGCKVEIAGVLADDVNGKKLLELLGAAGVNTKRVLVVSDRPTTTKTRIMSTHQQILRVDKEHSAQISHAEEGRLLKGILDAPSNVSAVVISDYAKGVVTSRLCQEVIAHFRELGRLVVVDPKGLEYLKYAGSTMLTPNRSELAAVTQWTGSDVNELLAAGEELRVMLRLECLAVTLGELGIGLVEEGSVRYFGTVARQVFDVCGAGDTVIAALTAALVSGLEKADALELANIAAGIVIRKLGTALSSREELLAELSREKQIQNSEKITSRETLLEVTAQWRAAGERLVFTNGCFDLLHSGHLSLLQSARREGDRLVVAVNSDRSVQKLKGPSRPINGEDERMRLLAAMSCVDAVVIFEEDTPLSLINYLRPDVLVKGSDYREDQVVGASEVRSWGGRVVLIPLVKGVSTTALLKKSSLTSH